MENGKTNTKILKEYYTADQKDWGRSICTTIESSNSHCSVNKNKYSERCVWYDSIYETQTPQKCMWSNVYVLETRDWRKQANYREVGGARFGAQGQRVV